MKRHRHEYSRLWTHFGPFGDQSVHLHPCVHGDGGCSHVLIGNGRNCDGELARHARKDLSDE
jgi:hypothetical protein